MGGWSVPKVEMQLCPAKLHLHPDGSPKKILFNGWISRLVKGLPKQYQNNAHSLVKGTHPKTNSWFTHPFGTWAINQPFAFGGVVMMVCEKITSDMLALDLTMGSHEPSQQRWPRFLGIFLSGW